MGKRGFAVVLAAVTLAHLAFAAWLPPVDDELYYWCWAQPMQLSYYDHPAGTAALIKLSTLVLGDTVFAIRLPAVLCSLGATLLIATLMPRYGVLAAVLLTPVALLGGILITPDAPLILAWTAYLVWVARVQRLLNVQGSMFKVGKPDDPAPANIDPSTLNIQHWILGGVLLGLGVLSKYTMALAVPSALVCFTAVRPWRRWLGGFVLHGLVAFGTALPILLYNLRTGFAPLAYQWEHTMAGEEHSAEFFPEFLGVQLLLVGALPFALLPWALAQARTWWAEPRLRACFCLSALPLVFFLVKALRGPLEGNWPLPAYIGFWPLAAHWLATGSPARRRLAAAAFAVPLFVSAAFLVHLARPFPFISPEKDRVTRQFAIDAVCCDIGSHLRALGQPVYLPSYQWTAKMRFLGVDAHQVPGWTRESHFTMRDAPPDPARPLWVLTEGPMPPELAAPYAPPTIEALFPLVVRGRMVAVYLLLRYEPMRPNPNPETRNPNPD